MYVQPPVAVGLRIDRFMLARSRPPLARVCPVRRIQAKLQAVRVDLIREKLPFFNENISLPLSRACLDKCPGFSIKDNVAYLVGHRLHALREHGGIFDNCAILPSGHLPAVIAVCVATSTQT